MVEVLFLHAKIGGRCGFSRFLLILDLVLELKYRASKEKGIGNAIEMPQRNPTPAIFNDTTKHMKEAAQFACYSSLENSYALFEARPPLGGLGGSNKNEILQ